MDLLSESPFFYCRKHQSVACTVVQEWCDVVTSAHHVLDVQLRSMFCWAWLYFTHFAVLPQFQQLVWGKDQYLVLLAAVFATKVADRILSNPAGIVIYYIERQTRRIKDGYGWTNYFTTIWLPSGSANPLVSQALTGIFGVRSSACPKVWCFQPLSARWFSLMSIAHIETEVRPESRHVVVVVESVQFVLFWYYSSLRCVMCTWGEFILLAKGRYTNWRPDEKDLQRLKYFSFKAW